MSKQRRSGKAHNGGFRPATQGRSSAPVAVTLEGGATAYRTDPNRPPVAVEEPYVVTPREKVVFGIIGLVGALAWVMLAIVRGEEVNAVWFVFAAIATYVIAFRFYARLIEYKVLKPRDTRATPAEEFENGKDFMPTDRRVLFGHHFAAIAGAGPLVGPVLAAQMGYLPGTIWIIVGVVFAGGVQDYMVLHMSIRRGGRSLSQMARDELGVVGGWAAIIGILSIMLILIAVLGIVVIGALAHSPWGVFSIAMTIPIALFMGVYLRYLRPGAVTEVSLIGCALLLLAIIAGGWVNNHPTLSQTFTLSPQTLAWCLIVYGFAASVLPVWLLLAPRDYLSTFMKVGTIGLLAIGILIWLPRLGGLGHDAQAHREGESGPHHRLWLDVDRVVRGDHGLGRRGQHRPAHLLRDERAARGDGRHSGDGRRLCQRARPGQSWRHPVARDGSERARASGQECR